MLARVKVTDSRSGQDYLLFISKLNLKGLLVLSLPSMPLESPVQLELSMGAKTAPLSLAGLIYKHLPTATGGRGTIIRFARTDALREKKLMEFIRAYEESIRASAKKDPKAAPSIERTSSFNENSLSHLALLSSDREAGSVASTMDEEAEHGAASSLSGHTIIANIKNAAARRDRSRLIRSLLMVAIAFVSALAWYMRGSWMPRVRARIASRASGGAGLPAAPADGQASVESTGTIEAVTYSDSPNFLKITLRGPADFARHFISKSFDPKRLIFDFPGVADFSAEETVEIDAPPIQRVRLVHQEKAVRVYFDFAKGADFGKYTVASQANAIDFQFNK